MSKSDKLLLCGPREHVPEFISILSLWTALFCANFEKGIVLDRKLTGTEKFI